MKPVVPKARPTLSSRKIATNEKRTVTGASLQEADLLPAESPAPEVLFQSGILAEARTKWQHGVWQELVALDPDAITRDPDRAKLALLVGAAHSHMGDIEAARRSVLKALSWGCSEELVARVMLSAVHNSLARIAASLEDTADDMHFVAALRLVEPHADSTLLARTRKIRETASIGLLPEALALMENDLAVARGSAAEDTAKLRIMAEEVGLLRHEMMMMMRRNQLYRVSPSPGDSAERAALLGRSPSQLGQDVLILEKCGFQRGGFFVEFGATDGILLSNSYLLETEFGWSGICAEPNPKFFAELRANRHCIVSNACIGPRTGDRIEFVLADVYGTITDYVETDSHGKRRKAYADDGKIVELETLSLEDLLIQFDAPREIDYLSIDTEGSEYAILATFPFDRWTIRFITVEHNHTPQREAIRQLLEGFGYQRTELQHDDFYELVPATTPADAR